MSPFQVKCCADPYPSYRADIAARTMENRLTGSFIAAGIASLMLIAVAATSSDITTSSVLTKAGIWQSVSAVICGSHLDALSLVGPGCGTAP